MSAVIEEKPLEWSIKKARETYHIAHWSDGFFDIAENGAVCVYPDGLQNGPSIDLNKLAKRLEEENISLPVLVRFPGILRKRIQSLNDAFKRAILDHNYKGNYLSVYPIKVNQERHVVQSILDNGKFPVGLETGSKPELLATLALSAHAGSVIICNGYKDREYIRLALIGQKLGHHVVLILEKMAELNLALEEAEKLNIEPFLGVRVRLSSMGEGKWQDSGGEKSKFGFSAPQLLSIVEKLKSKNRLHLLHVLHFHLGSQVANIACIQKGMKEGVRYYAALRELGAPIKTIDVGGGLGVDYEGTRSRNVCSMNYSIQEYANDIVYTLSEICEKNNLPHPNIITESGRAMTAHHAMLITNVISTEPACDVQNLEAPEKNALPIIHEMWNSYINLTESSALEVYHDICHWMSEVHTMYIHGLINLSQRAYVEQIYYKTCFKLRDLLKPILKAHRDILDELNEKLANKFVCNFSLFQSLPDAWAINQVFPIVPLSGLNNQPTQHGIIHDITCDSDGKIDGYVNNYGVEKTLSLLPYYSEKPYFLGIFLVGAYQEILGDLHNLFGDTHSLHVEIESQGSYKICHLEEGDTVESILNYVNFEVKDLVDSYQKQLKNADLSEQDRSGFLNELKIGLQGYTYFEE